MRRERALKVTRSYAASINTGVRSVSSASTYAGQCSGSRLSFARKRECLMRLSTTYDLYANLCAF